MFTLLHNNNDDDYGISRFLCNKENGVNSLPLVLPPISYAESLGSLASGCTPGETQGDQPLAKEPENSWYEIAWPEN